MSRSLTAAELLALDLPSIPADKGGLSRMILKAGWRRSPLARETDRGWEYELGLLPAEARAALLARESAAAIPVQTTSNPLWESFERLPEKAKATAAERLAVVDQVDTLKAGGMKAGAAVPLVAARSGVSASTLWTWLKLCDGVERHNRLAALAPQRKGRTATADCDPRAWDFLAADFLRAGEPSFAACYRRMTEAAARERWSPIPAEKTLQRRMDKTVPAAAQILARKGREAAARVYPHQTRDRTGFAALEAVNADGHRFDVFVKWPDGRVGRPTATVVQDLGTGMIVGWRVAESENWSAVRLAFADMVERYGIPEKCWLDNGRAFASKWLTGGMKTRYRFTIKDDEPAGILTQLGIQVHWATPYHGQAKPIERAFRDLCEEIAKHPSLQGAYTGNSPANQPADYGKRAIPIADFRALVDSEIVRHNARSGRRGLNLNGGSFADAFAKSLTAPGTIVRKASAAQRRLLLWAAEGVTVRKPTGEIQLSGNRYWHDALVQHMGEQLTVRFDPDNLHAPIAVYSRDGRFICEAPAIDATGFADTEAAQAHATDKKRWMRSTKELLAIEQRLGLQALADLIPKSSPAPVPAPSVIRLVADAPAVAPGDASLGEGFSRALRALADPPEETAEVIPFRAAETG